MTRRAVIIGLLLAAFIAGFTFLNDHVIRQSFFISHHLPHSVYGLIILSLLLANPLLARLKKGTALQGSEYAVILTLALASCAVPSSALLRFFGNSMMLPRHWERIRVSWQAEAIVEAVPPYMLAGTPPAFRIDDFHSPSKLCADISAGAGSDSLSPAQRRVWDTLPAEKKEAISVAASVPDREAAKALATAFNSILDRPDLYDAGAFSAVAIGVDPIQLLRHVGAEDVKGTLADTEQVRQLIGAPDVRREHVEAFNRSLIDAAWPDGIRSRVSRRLDELTAYMRGRHDDGSAAALNEIPWSAWARPLAFWLPLFFIMSVGVIALSLVLHRQWAEHELLPYPISQFADSLLPDKDQPNSAVVRSPGFLWAFGLVVGISMLNYLNSLWPGRFIAVSTMVDFRSLQSVIPLLEGAGYGWALFMCRIFPIVVGIAFLLREDVSLSVSLAAPISHVLGAVLGVYGLSLHTSSNAGGGLYSGSPVQLFTAGAFLAFLGQIIYTGRRYYSAVMKEAFGRKSGERVGPEAVWGARVFTVCSAAFAIYLTAAGLDWQLSILYTALMFTFFLVMSRVLAETGIFFFLPTWYPCAALVGLLGLRAVGPDTAVIMFMASNVMLVQPRESLMPFVGGALKLLDKRQVKLGHGACWAAAAVLLAIAVAVPVTLKFQYGGGINQTDGWGMAVSRYPHRKAAHMRQRLRAQEMLDEVEATRGFGRIRNIALDPKTTAMFVAGIAIVVLFSVARLHIKSWPLHPVMVLILFSSSAVYLWHSCLLGWLLRTLIVKYGGHRAYRRCIPMAMGLIAGGLIGRFLPGLIGAAYYLITGDRIVGAGEGF